MVTPTEDYYPDHDGGRFAPIKATTVATWRAPAFLENLAIDAEGAVFVTDYSHNRVDRYDPATGATTTFAELPAPPNIGFVARELYRTFYGDTVKNITRWLAQQA
jgi:sugar lactone lactonase YvrE